MAGNPNNGDLRHHTQRNGQPEKADPGAEAIQTWLVSKLSELLEIEPREIDVGEPFASYGLGSTELVGLSGGLADWLGRPLPAELAYECPTVEALARRLANGSSPHDATNEVSQVREANAEAIAIIGIGCRLPVAK